MSTLRNGGISNNSITQILWAGNVDFTISWEFSEFCVCVGGRWEIVYQVPFSLIDRLTHHTKKQRQSWWLPKKLKTRKKNSAILMRYHFKILKLKLRNFPDYLYQPNGAQMGCLFVLDWLSQVIGCGRPIYMFNRKG